MSESGPPFPSDEYPTPSAYVDNAIRVIGDYTYVPEEYVRNAAKGKSMSAWGLNISTIITLLEQARINTVKHGYAAHRKKSPKTLRRLLQSNLHLVLFWCTHPARKKKRCFTNEHGRVIKIQWSHPLGPPWPATQGQPYPLPKVHPCAFMHDPSIFAEFPSRDDSADVAESEAEASDGSADVEYFDHF